MSDNKAANLASISQMIKKHDIDIWDNRMRMISTPNGINMELNDLTTEEAGQVVDFLASIGRLNRR